MTTTITLPNAHGCHEPITITKLNNEKVIIRALDNETLCPKCKQKNIERGFEIILDNDKCTFVSVHGKWKIKKDD